MEPGLKANSKQWAFSGESRRGRWATLTAVGHGLRQDIGQVGASTLVMRSLRRMPAVWLGRDIGRLLDLPIYRAHLAVTGQADPLFFLSHRHYLARGLTFTERAEAATCHYLTEMQTLQADALQDIYHRCGAVLWSRRVAGQDYVIRLTAGQDVPHEGGMSLAFYAGETRVCVLSASIVPRRLVTGEPGDQALAVWITRKQLTRERDYQKAFFAAFDRSTPAHLVHAALEGLVLARGGTTLYGLPAAGHPTYSTEIEAHLTAAYDDFWLSVGGPASSSRAFALSVPMQLTPLDEMKPDRRARALARRGHGDEIRGEARRVVGDCLLLPSARGLD